MKWNRFTVPIDVKQIDVDFVFWLKTQTLLETEIKTSAAETIATMTSYEKIQLYE